MRLLPYTSTLRVLCILNLELSTSWKALFNVLTKSLTSSLFSVTAGSLKHFWAIYKNLLLKLMSCSSSNKLIPAFSLHNFLKWSILPCSSVVSSGYSVLSLSRNQFQDPASYSSKLVHWLCYHKRLLTCFVMNLKIVSKELMSRVKQATKDVVKSEV